MLQRHYNIPLTLSFCGRRNGNTILLPPGQVNLLSGGEREAGSCGSKEWKLEVLSLGGHTLQLKQIPSACNCFAGRVKDFY